MALGQSAPSSPGGSGDFCRGPERQRVPGRVERSPQGARGGEETPGDRDGVLADRGLTPAEAAQALAFSPGGPLAPSSRPAGPKARGPGGNGAGSLTACWDPLPPYLLQPPRGRQVQGAQRVQWVQPGLQNLPFGAHFWARPVRSRCSVTVSAKGLVRTPTSQAVLRVQRAGSRTELVTLSVTGR